MKEGKQTLRAAPRRAARVEAVLDSLFSTSSTIVPLQQRVLGISDSDLMKIII